ncbi:MAG: hypothetical protein KDN22_01665 [Verrucomicrobiae bacterium]|nr:hypothetical protein [Verrucomicrobiae bacterium]
MKNPAHSVYIRTVAAVTSLLAATSSYGFPKHSGIVPEPSPAADAFAAAHLALIFMVFLCFGVFAFVLYRRGKAPNKEREFIEELRDEELREKNARSEKKKSGAGPEPEEPREPWEKPEDWWKKQ